MARESRLYYPGAVYYVVFRGNRQQLLFNNDQQRFYFFELLNEGVERFGYRVHAFCLLNDAVHLLIEVNQVSLARIVQNLSFRFARYINQQPHHQGQLFQGRYKAFLVTQNSCVLALCRYLHSLPERLGYGAAADFNWSSHAQYLQKVSEPWLCRHLILSLLPKQQSYQHYMQAYLLPAVTCLPTLVQLKAEALFAATLDLMLLPEFKASQLKTSYLDVISQVVEVPLSKLAARSDLKCQRFVRAILALLMYESGLAKIKEMAKHFNISANAMAYAVYRLKQQAKQRPEINAMLLNIQYLLRNY